MKKKGLYKMYLDMKDLDCNVNREGKKFLAYVSIGKGAERKQIKARGVTADEAVSKLEKKLQDMGFVAPVEEAPKLRCPE